MSAVDPRIAAALPAWIAAGHGGKRALVEQLAELTGRSVQTVYRQLSKLRAGAPVRKRRADAGKSSVQREEIVALAALREETRRETGTGALSIENAAAIARANGLVAAERVDQATGEIRQVSLSTIRRAMRQHYVHRQQLTATTPAARLSSPHPNYLWQVDASISSQYYLAEDGLRAMPKREFYGGKPQNFERISKQRLWRYAVTDHASGCKEVFYTLGSESSANLAAALIHAMTLRPTGTMHGVPQRLMMDPGSANKSLAIHNLLSALGIEPIVNEVGNARAKGQVENAHHLVETNFEARLALRAPVTSLEEINTLAQRWCQGFNATRIHTRTGTTRRDGWLRITREQLIAAPSIDVLRALPNSAPKPCVVRDCMIQFKGRTFDVRGIPELLNGDRVDVVVNALDPQTSVRVLMPARGETPATTYLAPCIERDEWGFLQTAAQVGVEYKSAPQTPADAAAKELERTAMEVQTDEEAKAARKAKRLAFSGRIDPFKDVAELKPVPALPRASTPSRFAAGATVVDLADHQEPAWSQQAAREFAPYTHFEAVRAMRPRLEARGITWTAAMLEETQRRFPDGVPHDAIDAWVEEIFQRNRLRIVGGEP